MMPIHQRKLSEIMKEMSGVLLRDPAAIRDHNHEDHEEMLEWAGGR